MKNINFMLLLRYAAVTGNILFVLWISFNAMDEGFRGTIYQKLSAMGIIGLLIVNSILITGKSQKPRLAQHQKVR